MSRLGLRRRGRCVANLEEVGEESHSSKPVILVSACLVGVPCTHRGGDKRSDPVVLLAADARLVPVCPEVAGGLPTPRPEAERCADGRVRNSAGEDVTWHYARGATHAVALARAAGARRAVLKARSPSCGVGGVAYEALRAAGLEVVDEYSLGGSIANPGA
jgi:uncharacterized protein YbbK (DUF523 family)